MSEPETIVERSAERQPVTLVARLRQSGAKPIEVEVHDLSTHGFQVDTVHIIRPGQIVWLQFGPLAPLEAQVRWFRNYRIGCAFSQPLHPAVLDSIVAQARR
ncbi:PilZ domain-containing protein [Sphingomonas jatrophae]|uniref:PilZ domain-containing protein n=1 Tax=Sphingomonas jatrophae TaxID=1166337 RepID=A0A1I6M3M2_9SPHN|nr:PilZ domain-containing protein [Sphingomonas jatrophae]SFS10264.1 PilZ domain-containing protein [Sphingomonas jatrophae]